MNPVNRSYRLAALAVASLSSFTGCAVEAGQQEGAGSASSALSIGLGPPLQRLSISNTGVIQPFGGYDGLCLEVIGSGLEVEPCNGSSAEQITAVPTVSGTLDGNAYLKTASGLCVDILYGNLGQGSIDVTTCNGTVNQQWIVAGGIIESANKSSGSTENNYCLDVHDASSASGTEIDLAPCNGTIAQSFWLSGFTLALGSDHTDANTGNPECLDVLGNDEASGATLDDSDCNGTNAQWFVLNTTHEITLANAPSLCVTITTAPVSGSSRVALAPCSGTSSQQWYLRNETENECAPNSLLCYEGGGSNFVNYQTGTCLDIDGNNSASGTTIDAYTCTAGNQAQLWSIDVSFDAPQPAPPND
ncbi:MAG: ricin-type beta-trefoil lectin domain protein [Polyangiaceae bacterium]